MQRRTDFFFQVMDSIFVLFFCSQVDTMTTKSLRGTKEHTQKQVIIGIEQRKDTAEFKEGEQLRAHSD